MELQKLLDNNFNVFYNLLKNKYSIEINQFIKFESELYGSYNMQLILPIIYISNDIIEVSDLRKSLNINSFSLQSFIKFIEIYKDKKEELKEIQHIDISLNGGILGLYIPTFNINENWSKENKDCLYLQKCKGVKKLPVVEYNNKNIFTKLNKQQEIILKHLENLSSFETKV